MYAITLQPSVNSGDTARQRPLLKVSLICLVQKESALDEV